MIYRFIGTEKANHAVARLCRALRVSRSGFYAWQSRPPAPRSLREQALAVTIARVHADSRGTYGTPRVHAELKEAGVRVSRRRIARLMRELGIEGCGTYAIRATRLGAAGGAEPPVSGRERTGRGREGARARGRRSLTPAIRPTWWRCPPISCRG